MLKDFTPTKEQITLHGLGFIQVKLPMNRRLHVWHPDLPRRDCYQHSAIHNHRFSFASTVLIGTQVNQRYTRQDNPQGEYDIISHDGPRDARGGRLSFVDGRADFREGSYESVPAGESYRMDELEYHETPNSGVVVTVMTKLTEGTVHATSAIRHGHEFHQSFDRYQVPQDRLWQLVVDAFRHGDPA